MSQVVGIVLIEIAKAPNPALAPARAPYDRHSTAVIFWSTGRSRGRIRSWWMIGERV